MTPPPDPETDLVRRATAGDRAAFEALVRRTSRQVFARLYLDAGDPHRAEDLTQETYLRAFRAVRRLADPGGFRPWLLAIAASVRADDARRAGRRKRTAPPPTDPPAGPSPADDAQREEARQRVLAALRGLPDDYRLPLTLRYLAGADHAAIEAELGLTNGALRGLLHRGLKLLRDRLPPEFGDGTE